ncbi:MAG: hypothetical protein ACXVGH_07070 [Mycobacteriales bacterium]
MTEPSSAAWGPLRGVRAGVLAVAAVALAEGAHAVTDGCISFTGLLVALGVCWPAAVAVLGRQRGVLHLLGWLLGMQVVLHVLLESLCGEVVSGREPLLAHLSVAPSGRMLAAHALAVVLAAVLLGRADAKVWVVAALRRAGVLVVPLRVVHPPATLRTRRAVRDEVVVRSRWDGPRPSRRGPPALLAP